MMATPWISRRRMKRCTWAWSLADRRRPHQDRLDVGRLPALYALVDAVEVRDLLEEDHRGLVVLDLLGLGVRRLARRLVQCRPPYGGLLVEFRVVPARPDLAGVRVEV